MGGLSSSSSSSTATDYIPMARLPSRRSTTSSIVTTTSQAPTIKYLNTAFIPTSSLQIQSSGHSFMTIPLPPKQLLTPIFNPLTSRPVYLSIRPTRRSGSCRLVLADDEAEPRVATTVYQFGPGRPPVVRIWVDGEGDDMDDCGLEEFEMVYTSMFSRSVTFTTRRWGRFEWRYGNKAERKECAADCLLLLEAVGGAGERRVVARLVRNEVLRTAGTKKSTAGNGGRLEMELGEVSEVLVVVTCLVMLKKEVDRMRGIQMAMMSKGGGGP